MSMNYNRLTRPAAVLVKDGQADIILERETCEDLLRNDRIPERLAGGAKVIKLVRPGERVSNIKRIIRVICISSIK